MTTFIAPVGTKVGPITGVIRTVKPVESRYGESKLLIVELESGQLVKSFCSGASVLWPYWEAGESITILSAKVKGHEEFRGTEQTVLSHVVVDDHAKRQERIALDAEAKKTEVHRSVFGYTMLTTVGDILGEHTAKITAVRGQPGTETDAEFATRSRYPQLHTKATAYWADGLDPRRQDYDIPPTPVDIDKDGQFTEHGRKKLAELTESGTLIDYGEPQAATEPTDFAGWIKVARDGIAQAYDDELDGKPIKIGRTGLALSKAGELAVTDDEQALLAKTQRIFNRMVEATA